MHQPLVSILMTSFNREKYITQAIESVLASTYQDFELIIADDGSTDNTVNIANAFAEKDSRIRVYLNKKNLGDYPNRNMVATFAKGKYLKYLDSDDYIYPWGLQILVNIMEQYPEAGWGLCSLEQYTEKPFPFQLSPKEAYTYHYFGPGLFNKAPLSAIIKKDVFQNENGFNPIRMAGDFEMWHRLAQKYPVVAMPHGIVWYREHQAQEVNEYRKFIKIYENIKVQYLNDKNCPLSPDLIEQVYKNEKKKTFKEILKGFIFLNFYRVKDNFVRLSVIKNAQ